MRRPSQLKQKHYREVCYHVQVLCTNKLPLYFLKFSQQEKFDWNLRTGADVQSTPSLAQINLEKVRMKNELRFLKQHLRRHEYHYKCNHYSLVRTTFVVKQLHVTS